MTKALAVFAILGVLGSCRESVPDSAGYAHDLCFPGSGRIVAAEWNGKAVRSEDGGASWSIGEMGAPVHELSVGPDGTLWGIYRWHGIHEPSSACFVYSKDGGKSWNRVDPDLATFFPECFLNTSGTEPLVLAADGQIWRHVPQTPESPKCWSKVGTKNSDGEGVCGIATSAGIYVRARDHLWLSRDEGKTWDGAAFDSGCFCATRTDLWSLQRGGKLQRTKLGENTWTTVRGISEVSIPFKMVARGEEMYIAAEGVGWKAAAFKITPDGNVHQLQGLEGKQCYSVRIGPDGRAWFVAQGIFVENDDDTCRKVWPRE